MVKVDTLLDLPYYKLAFEETITLPWVSRVPLIYDLNCLAARRGSLRATDSQSHRIHDQAST